LAQWGAGDRAAALATIRQQIRWLDEQYRRQVRNSDAELAERDIQSQVSPLPLLMATLNAVLTKATDDPDAQNAYLRLMVNYKNLAERLVARGQDSTKQLAALLLENAWAVLLLGGNPSAVPDMVGQANLAAPVEPAAIGRFEGWYKFRTGDLDAALEQLKPLAEGDNMARLGVAYVLLERGDTRDGARELLAVAKAERGTALGLVAADRLEQIVGARVDPGPSAAELDAALAQLPQGFDRFVETAPNALGLSIEPETLDIEPFEPVRFRVTLTNFSPLTLAIDGQGPIDSRVACSVIASAVGVDPGDSPVVLIPIDRRFQLAPRESMTFTYDATLGSLGLLMAMKPLTGATVTARAVVNWQPAMPRVLLSFMGREAKSSAVRIEGVRTDAAWIDATWAELKDPSKLPDPTDLALMAHYLATQEDRRDRGRMLQLTQQWQEIAEIWRRLPPLTQAWVIMVGPTGLESDTAFVEAMRESNDPMVITSVLLKRVTQPTDSAIDVARRSIDPRLGRLAEGVQRAAERRIEDRQRDLGIDSAPPGP